MSQPEPPDLEAQIDALYALPLGEFTAERDALARRLRAEGDRERGAAVKGLAKPSAAAWVVNQLARLHPDELRQLLAAGEGLRRAHEAALAGAGAPALAAAAEEERRAVARLLERAPELDAAEGRATSEATLARVRETLHAAASDDDARRLIADGRLDRERRAVGLGPLAFSSAAPPSRRAPAPDRRAPAPSSDRPPREPAPDRPAPAPARRDAAAEREQARRLAAARRAADAARREAAAARAAHEAREEDHLRAQASRQAAEEERQRVRQALAQAEDALVAARAAEAEARAEARAERRRRNAADAALAAAGEDVRRLGGDDGRDEG